MLDFQFRTLVLIVLLSPAFANADIYRWTDETGKIHYSDKKPPGVTAEKKSYANVATPWRKVPKPERVITDEVVADDASKPERVEEKVNQQGEGELSQDRNDKKDNKKTKRLKAKKTSDTESSDPSEPVRLNKKDKTSSTPAKRTADIKENYKKVKEEYRKAN